MAPLDEGDAPLGHQSSHVAILHAKALGDSADSEKRPAPLVAGGDR